MTTEQFRGLYLVLFAVLVALDVFVLKMKLEICTCLQYPFFYSFSVSNLCLGWFLAHIVLLCYGF